MEIKEGDLTFIFDENVRAIKFDDTNFYRKKFNHLPGGKGVDIIADSKELLQLIEIKNCTGHEAENVWRTSTNNSRVSSNPNDPTFGEDSFDVEVAKKVSSTIACLYGAWTKQQSSDSANELSVLWNEACKSSIPKDKKQIFVILFLEGNFGLQGPESRSKRIIMKHLQDSISKKLSWLNCRVSVVDSDTYAKKLFEVI